MNYFLAPALAKLRDQINEAFPNRNKASDGWIGDASHAARKSDHNPDAEGMVCALDITNDPSVGLSADHLSDVLYASRDRRIAYIIANRLITTPSGTGSGNYGPWTKYTGTDPHTSHVHLSILHGAPGHDESNWKLPNLGGRKTTPKPTPAPAPTPSTPSGDKIYQGLAVPSLISRGSNQYFGSYSGPARSHGGFYASERPHIKRLQQRLIVCGFVPGVTNPNSGWADGIFDTPNDRPGTGATSQAVSRFQRAHMPNTTYFGQVWWDDWTKLFNL